MRSAGNAALTAGLVLLLIDVVRPEPWSNVAVLALAIVGTGARLEAAIRALRPPDDH